MTTGPTGSGKSTVVSLLQRFYEPQGGAIHIDGQKVEEFDLAHLRCQIGVVDQMPELFDKCVALFI